jgi:tetratricopeptide (TPR) repeat protein
MLLNRVAGNSGRALAAVLLAAGLLVSRAEPAAAQANVRVDSNRQLFAVMCALHAAGYQANVSGAAMHPVRARLRGEMLRLQGPAVEALRQFYRDHVLSDPAATLARYVSFAMSVGRPPDFKFAVPRDEIPPEALALEGFNEILAAFDREAGIQKLWEGVQAEYEREIRRVQPALSQVVVVSSTYLREIIKPQSGRTFTVYVEPLMGGTTSFRTIGDAYALMLNPGSELPVDEVRHALLHFLLDPLPLRYRAATQSKRVFLHYAARAPRLPAEYKDDFESFLTECLVKAVELRLKKLPPQHLAAAIDQEEQNGFVLVRALVRELENNFEKAEPAMSYYFPDLLRGVRVGEDGARLEKVRFAPLESREPAVTQAESAPPSELELWLAEGERQIAAQDGEGAATTFERTLSKYPGQPRAIYGLAVASVLRGDVEKAKALFQDVLQLPNAAAQQAGLAAWSHVYLGRIYDLEGSRELALSEYRAALGITGASEAARLAARRGLEKPFEMPRARPGNNSP